MAGVGMRPGLKAQTKTSRRGFHPASATTTAASLGQFPRLEHAGNSTSGSAQQSLHSTWHIVHAQ